MIDIVHKRCIGPDCKTRPSCNYEGETKPLYCNIHKKDNMIDIVHKRCIGPDCKTRPSCNYEGETKPLYCNIHKKDNMINIVSKRCQLDGCPVLANRKYKGYCLRCFMYTFPNEPVTRNYKTKEKYVTDFVKEQFKEYTWICDKTVQGGCSKRRPDMFLELQAQCIIVEIDENQHTNYDCSCNNKRLMELSQDVGHKPIVFVRFNPDDYLKNNKNIKSCWSLGKDGIIRIKKEKEWKERLDILKQQIRYWIKPENTTNKTIEIVQLFYDEYSN